MEQPNFFIIGAPKCGTTSLAAWLAEHPNIYMSPIKEPHFYSADLNHTTIASRREYLSLFKEAGPAHAAVGEASVYYLFSELAVPEIERAHPGAKYIAIVRNPVDMAYSFHEQRMVSQAEHISDFAQAWALAPERRQGKNVTRWCAEPRLLDYQSVCRLGEQLERLFRVVPRERVLILVLDDIKEEPRCEYLKVLRFLGVQDDGRIYFPVKNTAKELKWPRIDKGMKCVGEFWLKLKRFIGIPPHRFAPGVRKKIKEKNVQYRPRTPLDDNVKNELRTYFWRDIQILERLLGRNLKYWLYL